MINKTWFVEQLCVQDVRYDEYGIATHDRQTLPAVAATNLAELTDMAAKFDVIGIDEGQFFPDVGWAEDMANNGKVRLWIVWKWRF